MNTTPPNSGAQGAVQTGANPADYKIPQVVQDKFADLVQMILATESMSKEERNYWFQILPIMTNEQVERLRNILAEEKEQLAKLDDQYQEELTKLNQKHLQEWDEFERKQDRQALAQAEAAAEAEEADAEEDILGKLDEI